jgi:glycerate-2-kinase
MKQKPSGKKSASQTTAADINKTSTNEAQQIAREISAFAQSRSALLRRRQFLREQLAIVAAAMKSGAESEKASRYQTRNYGMLTTALKEELQGGPRTKRQLLEQLQRRGVPLGDEPLKVLDSVIYTGHFQRDGKLFSLAAPRQ